MLSILELEKLYLEDKKSIPDISVICSLPKSTVRKMLIDSGVKLRSRAEGFSLALGKMGVHNIGRKRPPMSAEQRQKISLARLGSKHTKGTRITKSVYVEFTTGINKGRLEHVVAIEQCIGRGLDSNECVHHLNHVKTDNRIENLLLMTRQAHAELHAKENIVNRSRDLQGRFL